MSDKKVISLSDPKLAIEGIEELEERLEMRKICGRDCCSSSFYGKCLGQS